MPKELPEANRRINIIATDVEITNQPLYQLS